MPVKGCQRQVEVIIRSKKGEEGEEKTWERENGGRCRITGEKNK